MGQHGKLIIVEGTDGSGKKTQTSLLIERMRNEGFPVETASFPQYGKKSAGLVEEYLHGTYGGPNDVAPKVASLFYALDRYDKSFELRTLLEQGTNVVLDRYVDSNAGHQGGKIQDDHLREEFLRWLYDIEYGILNTPKPDVVIILHLPAQESRRRILLRAQETNTTPDIHEMDIDHLTNAEKTYLWTAQKNPLTHHLVECIDGDQGLSREEIHEKVWAIARPVLTSKSVS